MKRLALAALFSLLVFPALAAQFPPVATGALTDYSTTISTAAVQVIPQNLSRQYLIITNPSQNNIACSTSAVVSIGGAGSVPIVPNGAWSFSGNFVPTQAFWCIAASSSTAITVKEGHQ